MLVVFFLLCGVGIVTSTAQSTQKEERELEDKIPKHLPIKVKVKNLNNEKWARDVEVEVTNTGDKPIYYLRLSLYFVDVKMDSGNGIGFPLRYGRPELVDLNNRAIPEDMPIQPGETYVFKTIRGLASGWEKFRSKHRKPHPKKVGIQFEIINYGDGTGFMTTGGLSVPAPQSSNSPCNNQKTGKALVNTVQSFSLKHPPDARVPLPNSYLPTRFLPVNFLSAKIAVSSNITPPQSGLCCPGTSCFKLKIVLGGNCFCDEDGDPAVETESVFNCDAPNSRCGTQGVLDFVCDDGEHTCTNYFIIPCDSPDPTPTPTPTPTPKPCATLDPATKPNPSC
jgi:hypothetical protein